jgi:hypothetical protein
MDVFEQLVLVMIIRREIINYALKNGRTELLNLEQEKIYEVEEENKEYLINNLI